MTNMYQLHFNKTITQYVYSLLNINRLVDGTIKYKLLNFLDSYSDYNQILIYTKTTFFLIETTNLYYE